MSASNTEVVVSPFDIWYAPVGTAFPDVGVATSAIASTWKKLGKDQSRSMDESGIRMNRNASDGEFRGYGAGRVRKLWTVSEDLMLEFMMADFTLETMSLLIEDEQTVLDAAAGAGANAVAVGSSAGSGYSVGDTLTVSQSSATIKPRVRVRTVNGSGGVTAVATPAMFGGRGVSTANNIATTGGSGTGATVSITSVTGSMPAIRSLTLGRRGSTLAKKQFAFLLRGAASPYVDGSLCQINVPCGAFEGTRELSLTRADPVKYSCTIRCIEDSGINGYAEILAVDAS